MQIINYKIDEKIYIPSSLNKILNNKKACILDIETTGLNRMNNSIILIGILYVDNKSNSIKVKQFFAEHIKEEVKLLNSFKSTISNFDYIITYNGNSFDIPFINQRLSFHNIDFRINIDSSFDLMKIIRKHKKSLNLSNCKLKTVEQQLGIKREDKISGKESIHLYFEYMRNKNPNIKDLILKHNFDDIYYLSKVLKIIDLIDSLNKIEVKFYYKNNTLNLTTWLDNIHIEGNTLTIKGKTPTKDMYDQIFYYESYTLNWYPNTGDLELKLQIHEGHLSNGNKCCYLDKEDYPFELSTKDTTKYSIPNNIIIIKENNDLVINNIKPLVDDIINCIFKAQLCS